MVVKAVGCLCISHHHPIVINVSLNWSYNCTLSDSANVLPRLKVSWIPSSAHKDFNGCKYSCGYGMPCLRIGRFSKSEMYGYHERGTG